MMGLRLTEGVPWARLGERSAVDAAALARLISGGFLTDDGERVTATPEGRVRLNAVLASLLP